MKALKLNDKVTLAKPAIDDRVYVIRALFADCEPGENEGDEMVLTDFADICQNYDDKPFFVKASELNLVE